MRYFFLIFGVTVVTVMIIAGKRGDANHTSRRPPIELFPDMNRQPKLRPQTPNAFFADGRSSRQPIAGTIAHDDDHYAETAANTGRIPGTTNFVENIPVEVNEKLLERGRQRFTINCSPCHGAQGNGEGVVKKLGLPTIANLHDRRIVELADGEIFNTITYGKNTMGPYGANVTIEDRWAIVAYVRSLQLSKLGIADDVPEQQRGPFRK